MDCSREKWKLVVYGPGLEIYRLVISDEYHLRLVYNSETGYADVTLVHREDGDVHEIRTTPQTPCHSSAHALQWAGVSMSSHFHNRAIECKKLEEAIVNTKGWKDMANQNV